MKTWLSLPSQCCKCSLKPFHSRLILSRHPNSFLAVFFFSVFFLILFIRFLLLCLICSYLPPCHQILRCLWKKRSRGCLREKHPPIRTAQRDQSQSQGPLSEAQCVPVLPCCTWCGGVVYIPSLCHQIKNFLKPRAWPHLWETTTRWGFMGKAEKTQRLWNVVCEIRARRGFKISGCPRKVIVYPCCFFLSWRELSRLCLGPEMVDMAWEKKNSKSFHILGTGTPKIQKGMKLNDTILDMGVTGACP